MARVDPGVRATVLSARDMFDSAGQIVGAPFVGWIGVIGTIRTALYADEAARDTSVGRTTVNLVARQPANICSAPRAQSGYGQLEQLLCPGSRVGGVFSR